MKQYAWFSKVGEAPHANVGICRNWKEAVASASATEWSNLQLEGKNQLTRILSSAHRERYRAWNRIVNEVKERLDSILTEMIQPCAKRHGLPNDFGHSVRWDLLAICMEVEFEDIVSPPFYENLDQWYEKGHFPCGWEGNYPEGRLIIF